LVRLIAEALTQPDHLLLVGSDQMHPHVLHFIDESVRRSAAQRLRDKVLKVIDVYRWQGREYREEVPLDKTEIDPEIDRWLRRQRTYEAF